MSRLERLLRPRHIAVFGGQQAEEVVRQCDRIGYAGEIWPVHPTRESVLGRPCLRSVEDLPEAPDASFVGVNREATVDIVAGLAARGAGGAVCYASGFGEVGDGAERSARLVQAAGAMPILGPNCYGFVNYLDGALLWPDQHGGKRAERGVAIVTQSSNIAINLTMQRRGLPVAYVLTAGNQAQTGLSDIALGLLDDPRVTAIGMHVEGVDDVPRFEALAAAARERGVPVVALTVGRSEEARAAAVSHTASLTGGETARNAFFARLGIPLLQTLSEFLETLTLLHVHGPLPGGRIAAMSCSGGEAALIADAAAGRAVAYGLLRPSDRERLAAALGPRVAVANPLDYHTYVWGRREETEAVFAAMLACDVDLSFLVLDFPREDRCDSPAWSVTVEALAAAAATTGARAALVASLPENLPETVAETLVARGIAPLHGIGEAMAAAEAAVAIGAAWRHPAPAPLLAARCGVPLLRTLTEDEAKAALRRAGLAVPDGRVVGDPQAAAEAGAALGFPVAVKALGVAHKTEAGAVRIGLREEAGVREAVCAMADLADAFLVERMVEGGLCELLVGVVRDARFGFLMTVGIGGIWVELAGDTASFLLPADREEMREALMSLRGAALLTGYRDRPPVDIEAALDTMEAVAAHVVAEAGRLEEVEVNPLILRGVGRGAAVADALIRVRAD